jgi:predicted GTPase
MLVFGASGAGKSTWLNFLMNVNSLELDEGDAKVKFKASASAASVTSAIKHASTYLLGDLLKPVTLVDMPGLRDTGGTEKQNMTELK